LAKKLKLAAHPILAKRSFGGSVLFLNTGSLCHLRKKITAIPCYYGNDRIEANKGVAYGTNAACRTDENGTQSCF
jgi:hypothetical protein